jgi:mono/diheme cytochrome c family protein
LLSGLTSAAAAATPSVEAGSVSRGRAFVTEHCSSCHAVGRVGESPYRPAPPLRTLNAKYDVEGLAEAFAEGIIVGHKGEIQMPEFVLQPYEIDDLIAYLKWLTPDTGKRRRSRDGRGHQ